MSSAHLFAEALDTVLTLAWTVRVWIVLCAVVAGLVVYAVVIVVRAVARGVWRACRAVWRGLRAPRSPSRLPRSLQSVPEPSQPRTGRPAPSWAQTDKEAA